METDGLKLASRNPVSPWVLEEVARAERWIARYRVKMALVLNPCTPYWLSTALLGFLMMQDLLQVFGRQELSASLRRSALSLWGEKRWIAPPRGNREILEETGR